MNKTHKSLDVTSSDVDEWVRFANELADSARTIARRYFRTRTLVESKPDATPVTVADREIEAVLRAALAQRYPDHGIIGEEYGAHGTEQSKVWVLDPIDGTQAFITGVPLFGSLISLVVFDTPVLGIIEIPALKERWVGTRDGVVKNGQSVQTSGLAQLSEAALFATSPNMFTSEERPKFDALACAVKRVRYGTDCYAYGLVAEGLADLVVEADMAAHDYMALIPVVEGAGGTITDWEGRPLGLKSSGQVLAAASQQLHGAALQSLRG
jgi:inositol-phosphate phosphatase/L-galactose 1-phosphate phosphatase/histidinol-phosphatase